MALSAQLEQLVADTITLTKRPDLQADTVLAVKAATRKIHLSDFYYKDLFETGVSFDDALFIQQFNVKELLPRFRSIAALRKTSVDVVTNTIVGTSYLQPEHVTNMLDSYNVHKTDVYYQAGDNINIRMSTAENVLILSCYLYPDTADATYSSWAATEFPEVIYYEAAATVFKSTGFDEQAAAIRAETNLWLSELRRANILETGV